MIPEKNANLQNQNTLAVPSVAEFYCKAKSEQCVTDAVTWAKSKNLPLFILGGGSNVLLDEKISGLVVTPDIKGISVTTLNDEFCFVEAGAGENWDEFVRSCLQRQIYGLENLSLIPGSVGACPIQNIGAYGVEVADYIDHVKVYDCQEETVSQLSSEQCEFGYRTSVFKMLQRHRYIVLSVTFKLSYIASPKIDYPALRSVFETYTGAITPEIVARVVQDIRLSKIPLPEDIPNAGSFFKNPVVPVSTLDTLKQKFAHVPAYPAGEGLVKLAAGWLIEKAGWKGVSKFDVKIHEDQALILTNPHKKPLSNVLQLANAIKTDVLYQFKVDLEVEPQRLI